MPKKNEEKHELEDIAAELKELALRLKELFVGAAKSEKAKQAQQQILDGFDWVSSKAEKVVADAKSGKLEADVKKNVHDTLKGFNKKIKDYSASMKPTEKAAAKKNISKTKTAKPKPSTTTKTKKAKTTKSTSKPIKR